VRGKPTYRDGRHPSRAADLEDGFDFDNPHIRDLVQRGRDLWCVPAHIRDLVQMHEHMEHIQDLVQMYRHLRRAHASDVPLRDVRATLEAMSSVASDQEARRALEHCDQASLAALERPLRQALPGASAAERLRAAATTALARLPARRGRRAAGYQVLLARSLLYLWRGGAGAAPPAIWKREDQESPVVSFAAQVFDLVEQRPVDRHRVARLLRAAQTRVGGN
jgi:hypothetical protein